MKYFKVTAYIEADDEIHPREMFGILSGKLNDGTGVFCVTAVTTEISEDDLTADVVKTAAT